MSGLCTRLVEGQCSDEAAEKMSKICVNFQGIAPTMQWKKGLNFIPDLQNVSAATKELNKHPKFVFNLQGIAPAMEPKKCVDFVLDLLKVIAPMKQPKKCPKFVRDWLKVIALMKQLKKFPKFVPLAESHCSDDAAEKMSGFCT